MARDPYSLLGVSKTASDTEIRAAYRKLAKDLHPDKNPGDARAEERFKQISAAYEFLKDPERRSAFDQGVIDIDGNPKGFAGGPFGHGGGHPRGAGPGGFRFDFKQGGRGFDGFEDLINSMFGGAPAGASRGRSRAEAFADAARAKTAPKETRYHLTVDFISAALGGSKRLNLQNGKSIEVRLPAGVETGQVLRLKGQGAQPGTDALVEISVGDHRHFTRDGLNIRGEALVPLETAILGGKASVDTIHGQVSLTIPKGSNSGKTLRLKGKGIQKDGQQGDHYVRVLLSVPDDPELATLLERWVRKRSEVGA
ncbi:MAG: DnaJ C-terminal domain-containing protein [Geminicoccaceae bacterium]